MGCSKLQVGNARWQACCLCPLLAGPLLLTCRLFSTPSCIPSARSWVHACAQNTTTTTANSHLSHLTLSRSAPPSCSTGRTPVFFHAHFGLTCVCLSADLALTRMLLSCLQTSHPLACPFPPFPLTRLLPSCLQTLG